MSVQSSYEFKFTEASHEEGFCLATGIGDDMTGLTGYLDHEVIQDVADPGHMMVSTRWVSLDAANAVVSVHKNDVKIKRIVELLPDRPGGFLGHVLS